jgi:hypothetical protein
MVTLVLLFLGFIDASIIFPSGVEGVGRCDEH